MFAGKARPLRALGLVCGTLLVAAAELHAATVFVGTGSGQLYRVPPGGSAEVFATLPGGIGGIGRSLDGTLFVCVNSSGLPRMFEVASNGSVSEIAAGLPAFPCREVVVNATRRVFVLLQRSPSADEIWEVFPSGDPAQLVDSLAGTLLPDDGAVGLVIGPGGDFFLPTSEQILGRLLRATPGGDVSVFFSPDPPLNLLVDLAVDRSGTFFILMQEKTGPHSNNRSIRRLAGNLLSLVAGADVVEDAAGHLTVGDAGEIFVIGGGFGGGDPVAYLERIVPGQSATTVATFPGGGGATAIEDDHFEGFATSSNEIPIISSPLSAGGLGLACALGAALVWSLVRRRTA